MKKKFRHILPVLYIILAACMWGTIGLFIRKVNEYNLVAMDIVFIRCFGAFVIMLPLLLLFNRKALYVKLKDIPLFAGAGIISIAFFNFCYFSTIQQTSLSVAAILLYTSPAFVILFSFVIFKEKLTIKKIAALVMALAGCLFVSGITSGNMALTPISLLTGIGSGIGYALYSIFGRLCLNKGYSSVTISIYSFFFCSLATLPFVNVGAISRTIIKTDKIWYAVAGLVIVTTLLAYLFYTAGLKSIDNGQASIIACIEPVVATLIGTFFYHEVMTISNFLGIVLILGAAVLVNLKIKYKY